MRAHPALGRLAAVATAGALAAGLLGGCDPAAKVTGPDPQEAADTLAAALSSGDFGKVEFISDTPDAVATAYGTTVDGMGDAKPEVSAGDVKESGDSATSTLSWTWPIGGDEWTYETTARMTRGGDEWQVAWDAGSSSSPTWPRATGSTPPRSRRGAARSSGAHGVRLVTERPVVRVGIDKGRVSARQAVASARRLAAGVGIDPAAYAKRVRAAGAKAFVEAIVYRRGELPGGLGGTQGIPGAVARGAAAAGTHPGLRRRDPRPGRPGDRRDRQEVRRRGTTPATRPGCRGSRRGTTRRSRGTPGVVVTRSTADGQERELFRTDGRAAAQPLRTTLDRGLQTAAERLLAGVGPASALVAIRPSTGDILAAANGAGSDGYNTATFGQYAPGLDVEGGHSAGPDAGRSPARRPGAVHARRSSSTARRFTNYDDYPASGHRRTSRCGPQWPTPATPP